MRHRFATWRLAGSLCMALLLASCWESYRIEADGGPLAPPSPRPLVPENGALTGSLRAPPSLLVLRPEFRWLPAEGDVPPADSYEVQVDDSCGTPGFSDCAFRSPEASVAGLAATRWRPDAPLPVSEVPPVGRRYYWRVRGWSDGRPSAWSAVRYVDVGRTPRDFNGDGYAEVVVGARYQRSATVEGEGAVHVFPGGPGGVDGSAGIVLHNPLHQENGHFGWSVAAAGDLDADGFGDLLVGAPQNDVPLLGTGNAYVYLGGAGGLRDEPDVVLDDPWPQVDALFGTTVASAGDVDADGFCDLVAGARGQYGATQNEGAVFLFRGAASGVREGWIQGLRSPAPQTDAAFGFVLEPAGDGNGDGFADLAVATPYQDGSATDEGVVFWLPGGPEGIGEDGVATLAGAVGHRDAQFGAALANLGDLDGDGYADLAVGEPGFDASCVSTAAGCGRVSLHRGSGAGVSSAPLRVLDGSRDPEAAVFGRGLCGVGDADGDGRPDLVVLQLHDGAVAALFLARSGLLSGLPDRWLVAERDWSVTVGRPGDVNGDGLAELVLGVPSMTDGQVLVFHGAADGFAATPTTVLHAPTETSYDFGGSLG